MDEIRKDNSSDDYLERENLWDEQWPGAGTADRGHMPQEPDNLDEELPFPESVGTTDSLSAVRDGEPYMPATDPPVLPGGREGIHVATGFGTSPEEETFSDPQPRGDEDLQAQALRILMNDSDTSKLFLEVRVVEGVVYLEGQVPSADDADRAAGLLTEYVPGVVEVVDRTKINPNAAG